MVKYGSDLKNMKMTFLCLLASALLIPNIFSCMK
jgi:hypothetical protein